MNGPVSIKPVVIFTAIVAGSIGIVIGYNKGIKYSKILWTGTKHYRFIQNKTYSCFEHRNNDGFIEGDCWPGRIE